MSRLVPIALALALLAAGCGGDSDAENPATASAKPKAAAGMPIAQYEQEVHGIITTVNDARSDYFHAGNTKAEARRHGPLVQKAYEDGIERVGSIEPPAVARDFQTRLVELWEKRADQLEAINEGKPFKPAKLSDLLYKTDRDGYLYDELFTLAP